MYDIFLEDYQIDITKAREQFSSVSVCEKEAEHLQVTVNQPAILVRRFAY